MDLSAQLRAGQAAVQTVVLPDLSHYEKVVFVGLGGSIMASEAINMLWLETGPMQYINRALSLPHWISRKHLVIASSWSGETAETINLVKQAIAQEIDTVVMTSKAESSLAILGKAANLPTIILPCLVEIPRLAMPAMLGAQLTILGQSAILNEADKFAQALNDKATSEATSLAQVIGDKSPLVYSAFAWRYLGSFWKTFINETAERHCFYNFIPGALHNELAAIKNESSQFCYLVLSDHTADELEINQLTRLASWFKKLQLTVLDLEITGGPSSRASENASGIKTAEPLSEVSLLGSSRLEKILYQYLLAANTSALLAGGEHKIPDAIKDFKKFPAESGSASGGK